MQVIYSPEGTLDRITSLLVASHPLFPVSTPGSSIPNLWVYSSFSRFLFLRRSIHSFPFSHLGKTFFRIFCLVIYFHRSLLLLHFIAVIAYRIHVVRNVFIRNVEGAPFSCVLLPFASITFGVPLSITTCNPLSQGSSIISGSSFTSSVIIRNSSRLKPNSEAVGSS